MASVIYILVQGLKSKQPSINKMSLYELSLLHGILELLVFKLSFIEDHLP